MEEKNNKSIHILNTSSNLLGICFIVLTSLKVLNLTGKTLIDEFTAVAIFMFMVSSLLSFLSLKSNSEKSYRYEKLQTLSFFSGFSLYSLSPCLSLSIF